MQVSVYNYWLNEQKEVKFSHHDWVKPQPAPHPSDNSAMFALPAAPAPPSAHVAQAGEQTGAPEGEEDAVTAILARIDMREGDAAAEAAGGSEQAVQASEAVQASAAPDILDEAEAASHSADDATVAPAAAEVSADADEAATVNVDADAPAHLSFDEDEDEARPAPSSGGPFGGTEELREIVPEQGGEQET